MSRAQASSRHSGSQALHPWQIPARGWLEIAKRIGRESFRDHIFIAGSGVAFLAMFALLPTLYAIISVYGVMTSPQALQHQLSALDSVLPPKAVDALRTSMHSVVSASGLHLGFRIVWSTLVALWVSVRAMLGIISALNIVYDEDETRSGWALAGTAITLAIGALAFWIIALVMIIGAPLLINQMAPDSTVLHVFILIARWVVIAATSLVSMAVLYRFGPDHTHAHWDWLSSGSMVGTLLWLLGSGGLSLYVSNFGGFNHVYGSLGILMVVQIWFFLTAFVFLLGAEFTIETQRQTKADIHD